MSGGKVHYNCTDLKGSKMAPTSKPAWGLTAQQAHCAHTWKLFLRHKKDKVKKRSVPAYFILRGRGYSTSEDLVHSKRKSVTTISTLIAKGKSLVVWQNIYWGLNVIQPREKLHLKCKTVAHLGKFPLMTIATARGARPSSAELSPCHSYTMHYESARW